MKYITKFLLLFIAVGLVSCSEDFLESEPTQLISSDQMVELKEYNPDLFNGRVSGLYSTMFQTGSGGTDLDHDDFGQKGYDIYMDLLCGDMVLNGYNYGWYRRIATFETTTRNTLNGNYKPWRYYYRIVRSANSIIEGLGGIDVAPELERAEAIQLGQARAMRAYAYFYLANLFVEEYDPAAKILPLYTSTEQQGLPKSTGAEVWTLIRTDLEAAVDLIGDFDRTGIHEVDQDVAKGLLAYTYLTIGDYTNAALIAQEVISKYSLIPAEFVVGGGNIPRNAFSYVDGEGADWIWGMDLTLDQSLDLVSWWGQVDYFTYSYAAAGDPKIIDAGLLASIRTTDVRYNWFPSRYPLNKFYHEARNPSSQRTVTSDYVYMRVEEMYLILAEALAFAGDDPGAQEALTALVSERDSDPGYITSLTGDDLKDEIYKQWRIEMWGEGKSYLAMKRFKATVIRQGHKDYNGIPIPYNDDRLTLEIPFQEIQDNPNL